MIRLVIFLIKKSELFSALSIRLVYLTGKSKVPIHPKHLIRDESNIWYKKYLNKRSIVLDAGSGSGQHALSLAPFVKKVVGLDNNLDNISIATTNAKQRNIKNANFQYANLEQKIKFKKNYFDLIVLFDILEHLHKRKEFLNEIKRMLKKDGLILVSIPNKNTNWKKLQRRYGISSFSDPDHKIEYTKKSITKELDQASLNVKDIIPISYDTPWVGFIDLTGGISLTLYKLLSSWKAKMLEKHPENSSGFILEVVK